MLEVEAREEHPTETHEDHEPETAQSSPSDETPQSDTSTTWEEEWTSLFENDWTPSDRWQEEPTQDDLDRQQYRESLTTASKTLRDHIVSQIQLTPIHPTLTAIIQHLIGCLDDTGYLNASVDEITTALLVSPSDVEAALTVIQQLDPPGVGARSLQECLLLQLRTKGISDDSAASRIVREHLPLLAKQHYRQIAKALRLRPDDVMDAIRIIRSLNPKPGAPFSKEAPGYVAADIVIQRDHDRYLVVANDAELPMLRINQSYRTLLKNPETDGEARTYLKGRMDAAMWLIKAIRQRNKTLERIAEIVLDAQQEFFERGPGFLKPLTFRDVALKVGVHESTVSRAISHKYVETPQGLLPFRSLFDRGVQQATPSETTSSEAIKNLIRTLIEQESPGTPLSDEELVALMGRRSGVKVARRTITKYREEMRIPASFQRRHRATDERRASNPRRELHVTSHK